jgi:hypothetical protein
MGFLVDNEHIVTCAHIISVSNTPSGIYVQPSEAVAITFLFEDNRPTYSAHVVKWAAPNDKACPEILDIAVLRIDGSKPPNAHPAQLIDREGRGNPFRAYGYPERYKGASPTWAYGEICDRLDTGSLQIQHPRDKGIFVQGGFSGGPVWDEIREGVVGMVVAAEAQDGIAHVIPSEELVNWCPSTVYRIFSGSQHLPAMRSFNPNAIEGEVRGLEQRTERSSTSSSSQVWTFRLDRFDNDGNRLRALPVQMRGRAFDGVISEGDYVEVTGKRKGGVLNARSVYNVTTDSTVTAKRPSRLSYAVVAVFVVIFLIFFGTFGYMFVTQSGILQQLPFQVPFLSGLQSKIEISAAYRGELASVAGSSSKPGTKFVQYYVTLSNINANNRHMGYVDLKLKDTNGNIYDTATFTGSIPGAMGFSTQTRPGDKVAGNVAFNIPRDAVPKSLIYSSIYDTATFDV